jgi:hypothetical protein
MQRKSYYVVKNRKEYKMVEIRNVGNLDKEMLPPLNSQNTDKQTGSSVFFASLKNNEPEASKKNNIRDLDFSNFPSKVTIQEGAKEYKISPQQVAVEKIQEFEEIVQAHNLEYPSSPISIDYTKFPDPKNYDNHCGKKTDFKLVIFKNALSKLVFDNLTLLPIKHLVITGYCLKFIILNHTSNSYNNCFIR